MSTEPDSSPRTGVSFSNEVEEASPVIQRRATNEELRSAKDRASLSQSAKAWDLDGDGELDDAELALKAMDKSHKGTLSKDQMYKLMSDNLQTQRELFKAKKVVMGLVAFTCVLAISNLGTSLAAAFLAKDTKSEGDKLVDATSGRTLKTDTTATVFTVDPEFDKQFSRRHRHLCEMATTGKGGNAVTNALCDINNFIAVSVADGEAIIDACDTGGTVVISESFMNSHIDHEICPIHSPMSGTYTGGGNGNNASPPGLEIKHGSVTEVSIQPASDGTSYTITGLTGTECTVNTDCGTNHVCERGFCKATLGATCSATSECAFNHVCEESVCKGTDGATCVVGGTVSGIDDCADYHSCPTGYQDSQPGVITYSACSCTSNDACEDGEVCAADQCGLIPDGGKSCQTQTDLNAECAFYGGDSTWVCDLAMQFCNQV